MIHHGAWIPGTCTCQNEGTNQLLSCHVALWLRNLTIVRASPDREPQFLLTNLNCYLDTQNHRNYNYFIILLLFFFLKLSNIGSAWGTTPSTYRPVHSIHSPWGPSHTTWIFLIALSRVGLLWPELYASLCLPTICSAKVPPSIAQIICHISIFLFSIITVFYLGVFYF